MEYQIRRLLKTGAIDSAILLADVAFHGEAAPQQSVDVLDKGFTNRLLDPLLISEILYKRQEYLYSMEYLNLASVDLSQQNISTEELALNCLDCGIRMYVPPGGLACEALCPQCHSIEDYHKVERRIRISSLQIQCYIGCRDINGVFGVLIVNKYINKDLDFDEARLHEQPVSVLRQITTYLEGVIENTKQRAFLCACLRVIIRENPYDILAVQKLAEHRGELNKVKDVYVRMTGESVIFLRSLFTAFQYSESSEGLQGIPQLQELKQRYGSSDFQRMLITMYIFQYQDADAYFRDLVHMQKSNFITDMDRVGFYQFKHGRYNEVIRQCHGMLACAPTRRETTVLKALVALISDQSNTCEHLLDGCLQEHPRHITALQVRAWCYVQKHAYTSAITLYKSMRQLLGIGVDFSIEVGLCNSYQLNKEKTEAFQVAASTLTKSSKNPKAYTIIGAVLAAAQNDANATSKSEKAFIKAQSLDPTCTEAALHLSKQYFRAGNYQHALDVVLNISKDHTNEMIHTQLGYVYTARKDVLQASRHFQLALELYPNYPAALAGQEEQNQNSSTHITAESQDHSILPILDVSLHDTDVLH